MDKPARMLSKTKNKGALFWSTHHSFDVSIIWLICIYRFIRRMWGKSPGCNATIKREALIPFLPLTLIPFLSTPRCVKSEVDRSISEARLLSPQNLMIWIWIEHSTYSTSSVKTIVTKLKLLNKLLSSYSLDPIRGFCHLLNIRMTWLPHVATGNRGKHETLRSIGQSQFKKYPEEIAQKPFTQLSLF